MVKKGDVKLIAIGVVSVILAGFLMNQFRDVGFIYDAHKGFDS